MKILYTGFDPFGGETINPAYEAVKLLPDTIKGAEVIKVEIPTVFGKGAEKMLEAVEKYRPDVVICVGQAGGRAKITPEFVGINYGDARIKDNEGGQPIGVTIKEDGENAYFTKLPVKAITAKLNEMGVPGAISYTAGTYVCNDVMYNLLYALNTNPDYKNIRGGFVHVPFAAEQAVKMPVQTPSMSLEMIAKGLEICGEVSITVKDDAKYAEGCIH